MDVRYRKKFFRHAMSDSYEKEKYLVKKKTIIEDHLNEYSSIRKVFNPFVVQKNEMGDYDPSEAYDLDYVLINDQGNHQKWETFEEIDFPYLRLESRAEYSIEDIIFGNFFEDEKATRELCMQIQHLEELYGWTLFDKLMSELSSVKRIKENDFSFSIIEGLNEVKVFRESKAVNVFMSRDYKEELTEMVKDIPSRSVSASIKQSSLPEWNVYFVDNSNVFPHDKCIAIDVTHESKPIGIMPIKKKLSLAENPMSPLQLNQGFIAREEIGFAVLENENIAILEKAS